MGFYTLNVPEEIADGLRVEAETAGRSMRQHLLDKLTTATTVDASTVSPPVSQPAAAAHPVTLDEAAAVFVAQLDEEHQKLIHDCAHETGRPVSAYILSYILLARDQGLTAKPIPEYLERGEPEIATVTATEPTGSVLMECAWCHRTFTPTRNGQQYCPEPDGGAEPCARKAALSGIRERRQKAKSNPSIPAPTVFGHTASR